MRSFIHCKRRERSEKLEQQLQQARKDFSRIVEIVIHEFRPERPYKWGSLVDGNNFQEISDIDLAVAGISDPEPFFRLYGKAEDMTSFPPAHCAN